MQNGPIVQWQYDDGGRAAEPRDASEWVSSVLGVSRQLWVVFIADEPVGWWRVAIAEDWRKVPAPDRRRDVVAALKARGKRVAARTV